MPRCARSTRTGSMRCWRTCAPAASTSDTAEVTEARETSHARKNQAGIVGRYRPLLHDEQKQETDAGEDGDQEVRSRRPQARHVQGNEAQVTHSSKSKTRSVAAIGNECVIPAKAGIQCR